MSDVSVEMLARVQFALTIAFHYIYPPISIGLGVILVMVEVQWLRTGEAIWERTARFWTRVFGLTFAIGVATGIVMEFEFGTNWATYSRYVGDVFGSALAAEGIFAFFLESGFLALLLFGWDKVGKKTHFFATCMVALGAHFSAVWIIVANSWMQTPAGYHLVYYDPANAEGVGTPMPEGWRPDAEQLLNTRAEITDFWELVFNPSTVERLSHTLMGCWQQGAWFVISVSAFYLLVGRHKDFAIRTLKAGLILAVVASFMQLVTGHMSAEQVAETQPTKLAAMEGLYEAENEAAPLHIFGWVDEEGQKINFGVAIPGLLSYLVHGNFEEPVKGLKAFPEDEWPPVNIVFQSFHIMVGIGMLLIPMSLLGAYFTFFRDIEKQRWLLYLFVPTVGLTVIANQLGWIAAEVGRQPWIVYGLLRTKDGLSKVVTANMVWASLVMFTFIYVILFILWIYLLNAKIQHGPEEDKELAYSKISGSLPDRKEEPKSGLPADESQAGPPKDG
jgi:cytochrome d ubiquinol oxidase subunit I